MHDFFLNAHMMYVWMIFFLWENAFMKSWTFSFWKWIYECMIFFECIYSVSLNDFILFYEKMHLWNFGLFLLENTFMNGWFFLDLFLFSFHMYAHIFFLECIYKWNFWECVYDVRNSRKVYKRFCECIRRYSQADFVSLKIQAWKSIFYFLSNFLFFLITHEWMLEIVISKIF